MTTQDFEYKITKKRAVKVEELPPKEMIEYKFSNLVREKKQTNRNCVRCGQEATYWAYFKVDRKGTLVLEKYCSSCLDKWVWYG